MVISPYRTQLTRMIQNGDKNPERDMTNRKASQRSSRAALREAREAKHG